jgi:hypothetical protein
MQIEGFKARLRENPLAAMLMKAPQVILDRVRAPGAEGEQTPGSWRRPH